MRCTARASPTPSPGTASTALMDARSVPITPAHVFPVHTLSYSCRGASHLWCNPHQSSAPRHTSPSNSVSRATFFSILQSTLRAAHEAISLRLTLHSMCNSPCSRLCLSLICSLSPCSEIVLQVSAGRRAQKEAPWYKDAHAVLRYNTESAAQRGG